MPGPIPVQLTQHDRDFEIHQTVGRPACTEPSVMFVSFHRCASSFIASRVLNACADLTPVDYETRIFTGQPIDKIIFREFGYAYGVIRLADYTTIPEYRHVARLFEDGDVHPIRKVFLVRDPRDVIVSMYYSFGFTHALSDDPSVREQQVKVKAMVQQQGIDQFAFIQQEIVAQKYRMMSALMARTPAWILVRYEDIVHDFDGFFSRLSSFVRIDQSYRQIFYSETRPRETEVMEHRRSGRTGQFKHKLQAETLEKLTAAFAGILREYGYGL